MSLQRMNVHFQFLLACISHAIETIESVQPLLEEQALEADRPRKTLKLLKQWFSLMQQGKEAQARQMKRQLRIAAASASRVAANDVAVNVVDNATNAIASYTAYDAAIVCAAWAAANAPYAAPYAASASAAAYSAARAVAYAEKAKGNDWNKARKAEIQWQDKEAARLIEFNKGEILWGENAAIFLMGEMNLWMKEGKIHMIESKRILL